MVRGRAGGPLSNLEFFLFIIVFLSVGMVEPVWFGLVKLVSDFENRNRTKPN
jgi:hypothetical protein